MNRLAPSILSCDFAVLGEQIKQAERGGAEYLHIDVMDGVFVPNISFGIPVIKSIRKITPMFFDVHLMVDRPERYISAFADAGADMITFHYEATLDAAGCIRNIKEHGKKAGISINPSTPVSVLRDIAGELDTVLLMSVNPGFGGQKFIPDIIDKIAELKAVIGEGNADISVDGGINAENVGAVLSAGANIIVAGSAVFGQPDIEKATAEFMGIIKNYDKTLDISHKV